MHDSIRRRVYTILLAALVVFALWWYFEFGVWDRHEAWGKQLASAAQELTTYA